MHKIKILISKFINNSSDNRIIELWRLCCKILVLEQEIDFNNLTTDPNLCFINPLSILSFPPSLFNHNLFLSLFLSIYLFLLDTLSLSLLISISLSLSHILFLYSFSRYFSFSLFSQYFSFSQFYHIIFFLPFFFSILSHIR